MGDARLAFTDLYAFPKPGMPTSRSPAERAPVGQRDVGDPLQPIPSPSQSVASIADDLERLDSDLLSVFGAGCFTALNVFLRNPKCFVSLANVSPFRYGPTVESGFPNSPNSLLP